MHQISTSVKCFIISQVNLIICSETRLRRRTPLFHISSATATPTIRSRPTHTNHISCEPHSKMHHYLMQISTDYHSPSGPYSIHMIPPIAIRAAVDNLRMLSRRNIVANLRLALTTQIHSSSHTFAILLIASLFFINILHSLPVWSAWHIMLMSECSAKQPNCIISDVTGYTNFIFERNTGRTFST